MYIEQMAVVWCNVAEIAIAYRRMFFLIRIDTPPEALSPVSCM